MDDNNDQQIIQRNDNDSQLSKNNINKLLKGKNEQHLTLRKQINQEKLNIQRQKRNYGLKSNDSKNKKIQISPNVDYYFFEESEIINFKKINSISKDYKILISALVSDNFNIIKWAIFNIRRFFEIGKNIPFSEYATIFDCNFEKYFLVLLNKYPNDKYVANEVFFIIANLFGDDLLIIKYRDSYFKNYLFNDEFSRIYSKWLCSDDPQIIESIILVFRNILCGKKNLIKKFISNKRIINCILRKENTAEFSIKMLNNLVSFFYMVIQEIKVDILLENEMINIFNIMNKLFYIYKIIDVEKKEIKKKAIEIINKILLIILMLFNFQDNELEYYFVDYLFAEKSNTNFIYFLIHSLLNNMEHYLGEPDLFFLILDIFYNITNNSKALDIETLLNWGILEFFNEIFNEKYGKILMFYNNKKLVYKLIKIFIEIVDSEKENAKTIILSKCFDHILAYFKDNIGNIHICDIYLNLFYRLINYYDEEIAEIIYQRGIIKDAITYFLLYNNFENNTNDINEKCCIIINAYLETKYEQEKKGDGFNESDYKLLESFKDIIKYREFSLSKDLVECLHKKNYMNYKRNLIETGK